MLITAFGGGAVATGWVILINAASYAAPILTLRGMDSSRLDSPALTHRGPGAIREGFAYVRARPDLLLILAIVFSAGTFGLNFQMTSALMATEVFDKGATGVRRARVLPGDRLAQSGALLAARREHVRQRLVIGSGLVFGALVDALGTDAVLPHLRPAHAADRHLGADADHQRQRLHAAAHRRRASAAG